MGSYFLSVICLVALLAFSANSSNEQLPPKKLAIFYGWPIAVNGAWSVPAATAIFNNYDLVVFGDGLQSPSHAEYNSTKDIINSTSAKVYGYIDATLSLDNINVRIANWSAMGVHGVFLDQFGFDYGLNRSKQNSIIENSRIYCLSCFVNAWNPDDVFALSDGLNTQLRSGDLYLAESHYVIDGEWQDTAFWKNKSDKMQEYKTLWGVSMACVTTTSIAIGFDQNKWDNAYYAHSIYGFDSSGWGEPNFSASDSLLPYRDRAPIYGNMFMSNLEYNDGLMTRDTNVGLLLDTVNHTINHLL